MNTIINVTGKNDNMYVNGSPIISQNNLTERIIYELSANPVFLNSMTTYFGGPENSLTQGNGYIVVKDANNNTNYFNPILNVASNSISISGDFLPNITDNFTLGNEDYHWKDLFVGPGSIRIQGPIGSPNSATIGSDLDGIVYTESGIASPFYNIGPFLGQNGAVGGWQIRSIQPTEDISGNNFVPPVDLVAQVNTPSGLTGKRFSLLSRFTTDYNITTIYSNHATGANYINNFDGSCNYMIDSNNDYDIYLLDSSSSYLNIYLPPISSLTNKKRVYYFSPSNNPYNDNNDPTSPNYDDNNRSKCYIFASGSDTILGSQWVKTNSGCFVSDTNSNWFTL